MTDLTWFTIKRYFRFDEDESRAFVMLSLIFAFILSFDKWGADTFSFAAGLKSFVIALVLVICSLLIHDSSHRLMAIKMGYTTKMKVWWYGTVFCLLLVFISNGALKLFIGPSVWFTRIKHRRLAKTEYLESPKHFAIMSLIGPMVSLLFAATIRSISQWIPLNPESVNMLIYFNLVFGILAFLPIPPLDGSKFLFYGRLPYVFIFTAMVSYGFLYSLGIPSILIALIFGFIAAFAWFYKVDREIKF